MAFKLNNLVERVKSKMSGIPQTLNQIGQNLTDDEGLYQRGRFTPLQAIPQVKQANQAITNNVIKPMAQNTYNTAKPILNYLDPRGYQAERQDKTVGINSLGTQKLIGAAKAMPATAANLYGYRKLTPLTVGLSGAFGGVVNKATGGSFQQGFQQGVGVSPTIAGIGSITNPFISSVAGKAALPFNNPFAKQAVSRIATGIGNIPEGIAMSQGMGQAYSPGQAAFDFASGATFGSQAPNAKVKVKGAFGRRPNNIHPEDINAMDYAIDMFRLGKTPEEKKQAKQILYTLADRYLGTKERPESGDIKVIIKKLQNKANSSDVGMEGFQMGIYGGPKATGYKDAPYKFSSMADKKPRFEIDDSGAKLKKYTEQIFFSKSRQAENNIRKLKSQQSQLREIEGDFKGAEKLQSEIEQLTKNLDRFYEANSNGLISRFGTKKIKAGELIDHPNLFKNYPELKNFEIEFTNDIRDYAKGSYDDKKDVLKINTKQFESEEDLLGTILHELQHKIQTKENFATGGSPAEFINEVRNPFEAIGKYKKVSGEIEARDVQARMNLTPEQRRTTQPYASQNIPLKDQIVRFDGGTQASTDPLIQEARKYKSAEEFVKETVYRANGDSKSRGVIRNLLDNQTTKKSIKDLIPNVNNPQLDKSTISIYEDIIKNDRKTPFVLVDGNNVIDGHHKLEAYKNLGFNEVPTISKSQLTDIWNKAQKGDVMMSVKGGEQGSVKSAENLMGNIKNGEKVSINGKTYTYEKGTDLGEDFERLLPEKMYEDPLVVNRKNGKTIIETIYEGDKPVLTLQKQPTLKVQPQRKYPPLPENKKILAEEARKRGYNNLNPEANVWNVKEELQDEIQNAKSTMQKLVMKYVDIKAQTKDSSKTPAQMMTSAERRTFKEAEQIFDRNMAILKTEYKKEAAKKLPGIMLTTSKTKAEGPKMRVKVKPERLPWETPADILKEKKLSNFDRLMEEADQSAGFKSPQQIEEDLPKTARAVSKKVNILDYLRTPDRVLEKIGLKQESDKLKRSYNKYLDELPKEIDKVTSWYERVKNNPGAEQRIFRYLDGQDKNLSGEELKVAKEMQNYLEQWADKLGLPQDKRIASYITHIFDKDFIEKEFDEDLAKIISEKIPGSVYDPFLQKRLGKMGYKEDVFQALDAYVKRATRKYNMDPALEKLRNREDDLDLDSWKYVKSLTDRVNMRPTDLDNLLDNFIKSTPVGYRATARPTAYLTRGFRQMVYRATLGLNVGSALRNLSQGANTYAKLGEKYTGVGYMKALRNILSGDDELKRVGVLRDNMIQDRTLSSTKKVWEQFDRGLWAMFDMAEKINRGAAYFGAKSRALAKGKSEKQAIEEGIKMARDTQFTFGSVDTPAALQGDIMKSALQFQSYNVKQAEFLAEMAKNKDLAGMARYIGANLAIIYSFGKLIGMEPTDMIPFFNQIQEAIDPNNEGGKTPPSPAQTILSGVTSVPGVFSGDETTKSNSLKRIGKAAALVVPGGTQIRKSVGGVADSIRGYNPSSSGRVRFAVNNDPLSATRNVLFGSYNNENARDYFNNKRSVLGEKQSAYVANSRNPQAEIARIRQIQDQEKKLGIKPAGGTGNTAIDLSRRELKISNNGGLIADTKKQEQNNGIFSFFGGKKTEASETPKSAVDEYIRAYELDKYIGKAPTDPLKKITYEKNKLSKVKSIYNDDGTKYPDDIKKALIEKMGYNTDDIRYDVAANLSTAERASYMVERMKSMDEKQALQFLEDTRTKSLSDKIMGTKSVYDLLIENGYMDKATRDYLLSFEKEIDSKTRKYTKKSTKKGKKLTKLTLPKVSPIKLTPITLSKISMPKAVNTKTQLKLPNKSRTLRIKV